MTSCDGTACDALRVQRTGAPGTGHVVTFAMHAQPAEGRKGGPWPQAPWMVTLIIWIGVLGRSCAAVGEVSIFFTTSMPEVILPNTGCLD
jgi:hypothetical protein